ncbi:hypothetical protein GcC1_110026 [Golovinomyces cichoracearum]|uniref:Uncharacterized protein n=1 Tax=Golovinomyces cichoracearum TaxID=62708 RepID=A0A420I8S5_9PEZI|nr:hypothetical protein GcC1_110026 [Golovinomyces cichoracearum]
MSDINPIQVNHPLAFPGFGRDSTTAGSDEQGFFIMLSVLVGGAGNRTQTVCLFIHSFYVSGSTIF